MHFLFLTVNRKPIVIKLASFSGFNLTETCNTECSCTTEIYEPVCDDDINYFSPCHAGCKSVEADDQSVASSKVRGKRF